MSGPRSVFDFSVKSAKGETTPMSNWKGKVLLIVNVASKCGFTPQYKGLQELHEKYGPRGFSVIGFPCNQFMGQEPGTMEEITKFACDRYKATFPLMSKIDVNGSAEEPLYKFLKESLPGILGTKGVKWNFTKFLCDKEGKPVKRYGPNDSPDSMNADIEKLL